MAEVEQKGDANWDRVMQSLDLLFARVDNIDKTQNQLRAGQEMGVQAMEKVIRDQALLAR